MIQEEKLQVEIDLLMSFNHVEAWTGPLGKLKQNSYVLYSDIIKLKNKKVEELKRLNKEL